MGRLSIQRRPTVTAWRRLLEALHLRRRPVPATEAKAQHVAPLAPDRYPVPDPPLPPFHVAFDRVDLRTDDLLSELEVEMRDDPGRGRTYQIGTGLQVLANRLELETFTPAQLAELEALVKDIFADDPSSREIALTALRARRDDVDPVRQIRALRRHGVRLEAKAISSGKDNADDA